MLITIKKKILIHDSFPEKSDLYASERYQIKHTKRRKTVNSYHRAPGQNLHCLAQQFEQFSHHFTQDDTFPRTL